MEKPLTIPPPPPRMDIPPPPNGRAPLPESQDVPPAIEAQVENAIELASSMADTHAKLDRALARTEKLANILDKKMFLDPILGLIPVIGDKVTAIAGLYIVAEAIRAGVPKKQIAKMLAHLAADAAAGFLPGIGDVADFFYKSHAKNVEIFRKYIKDKKQLDATTLPPPPPPPPPPPSSSRPSLTSEKPQ